MEETRARKTGRRGGRRRTDATGPQPDAAAGKPFYARVRNPFPPVEILSEDEVEAIHQTSLRVLRDIGIKVLSTEARTLFASAGAIVDEDGQVVRLGEDIVDACLGSVRAELDLHGRQAATPLRIGGPHVAFAGVGGPPNFSDMEHGRRPGTLDAFRDFVRLTQAYDILHLVSPSVEPVDIHLSVRHLEVTRAMVTLSDKIPFVFSRGADSVSDALEIIARAHGLSREDFEKEVRSYTVVNANSPLQLDDIMCQGIIDFARAGQLMILTPFTLAGAMAPVSLAGALAQQNAEALAGICLSQIVRPGAPVAYGGFTSNVDMKSGAPAFGTPEYVKAAFASGQLTRRYGVPYRSSNVNASNTPDAQAAYEAQMSIWGALMGGCNLLMHGAGWLEGGLTASFEKFIIDVDMLQMMAEVFRGLPVDTDALAFDAMEEVGHGGHFFGAAHTLARYQSAFYSPIVSDWSNYETWMENGALTAEQRAHRIYRSALETFTPPPMDPARAEAIDDFVERRVREGGISTDF